MASSVPTAIQNFVSLALAALPAGFVAKFDTNTGPYAAPQMLLVSSVVVHEDEPATLGPDFRHEEHYSIRCALCSTAGDNDENQRMVEVYALYKTILNTVANNPTLSVSLPSPGPIRVSWCRQVKYLPSHDATGKSVGVLTFEVECQARVDSLD